MFAVLSCALQAIHLPQKSQCRLQLLQIFLSTHGTVLYTSLMLAGVHSSFLAFSQPEQFLPAADASSPCE